jgi:hypothetical protein
LKQFTKQSITNGILKSIINLQLSASHRTSSPVCTCAVWYVLFYCPIKFTIIVIYIKILLDCDLLILVQLIPNSSAIFCNHSAIFCNHSAIFCNHSAIFCNHSAIFCNHSAKICSKLIWLMEKHCEINQSV